MVWHYILGEQRATDRKYRFWLSQSTSYSFLPQSSIPLYFYINLHFLNQFTFTFTFTVHLLFFLLQSSIYLYFFRLSFSVHFHFHSPPPIPSFPNPQSLFTFTFTFTVHLLFLPSPIHFCYIHFHCPMPSFLLQSSIYLYFFCLSSSVHFHFHSPPPIPSFPPFLNISFFLSSFFSSTLSPSQSDSYANLPSPILNLYLLLSKPYCQNFTCVQPILPPDRDVIHTCGPACDANFDQN